jgi:hypothetical protein
MNICSAPAVRRGKCQSIVITVQIRAKGITTMFYLIRYPAAWINNIMDVIDNGHVIHCSDMKYALPPPENNDQMYLGL